MEKTTEDGNPASKSGQWTTHSSQRVIHSTTLEGSSVCIEGRKISCDYRDLLDLDSTEHEVVFFSTEDNLDHTKRMAEYIATVMRLLRDADQGDSWSIECLDKIVSEEPPWRG